MSVWPVSSSHWSNSASYTNDLVEEGEKIPEVKCLASGLRKENLRFSPHGEVGTVDDAFDARPGFTDTARDIQVACKGAKF